MRKDRIKILNKKKVELSNLHQNETDNFKKRELFLKKQIVESQLRLLKHQVYKMNLD